MNEEKELLEKIEEVTSGKSDLEELTPCVYLETGESLEEQKKQWPNEDPSKHIDFSIYPLWIVTAEALPEGFTDGKEVFDYMVNYI